MSRNAYALVAAGLCASIDSELRLLAAVRRSIREQDGVPASICSFCASAHPDRFTFRP